MSDERKLLTRNLRIGLMLVFSCMNFVACASRREVAPARGVMDLRNAEAVASVYKSYTQEYVLELQKMNQELEQINLHLEELVTQTETVLRVCEEKAKKVGGTTKAPIISNVQEAKKWR